MAKQIGADFGCELIARFLLCVMITLCIVFGMVSQWISWEDTAARSQAISASRAAASHISAGLGSLMDGFDRATAGIGSNETAEPGVALTTQLLHAGSTLSSINGLAGTDTLELFAYDHSGVQIASTGVRTDAQAVTLDFRQEEAATRLAVDGCGSPTTNSRDPFFVRSLVNAQGRPEGWVTAPISAKQLHKLLMTSLEEDAVAEVEVKTNASCILFSSLPGVQIHEPTQFLSKLYLWLLSHGRVGLLPEVTRKSLRTLTVVATVSPDGMFRTRIDDLDRNAAALPATILALLVLQLIVLATIFWPIGGPQKRLSIRQAFARSNECGERLPYESVRCGLAESGPLLAEVGNDIRRPLAPILGICSLLLDSDLNCSQRAWLTRVRSGCELLFAKATGLIEVQAADAGCRHLNLETINIAEALANMSEVVRPQAEDKGLDFDVEIDTSVLGYWRGDLARLRQVFLNLFENAVKFTSKGGVSARANVTQSECGSYWFCLNVADTGCGIEEDNQKKIFEYFTKVADASVRGQVGLGIGLGLCRDIAQLMGGHIHCESKTGSGSRFTFEVPVIPLEAAPMQGAPLSGRNAIIVGLSEASRRAAVIGLKMIGFHVETAVDGFAALGLAERMAYFQGSLDLMVIDRTICGLSAAALIARMNASPTMTGLRIVVIADEPPSLAVEESNERLSIQYLSDLSSLARVVYDLFEGRSILQDLSPGAPDSPELRALIIDDRRTDQAVVASQLSAAGIVTQTAASINEIIGIVMQGGIDIVIIDMQMEAMDSLEMTNLIRALAAGTRLPIIGLSADLNSETSTRCQGSGIDLMIYKPVDYTKLPEKLRDLVASRRMSELELESADSGRFGKDGLEFDPDFLKEIVSDVGLKHAYSCAIRYLTEADTHVGRIALKVRGCDWDGLDQLTSDLAEISFRFGAVALSDGLLLMGDAARSADSLAASKIMVEIQSTWLTSRRALMKHLELLLVELSNDTKRAA